MIIPMTKYSFILLSEQTEGFLESIAHLGLLDIKRDSKASDELTDSLILQIQDLKKSIEQIEKAEDDYIKDLNAKRRSLTAKVNELKPWGDVNISEIKALEETGIKYHFHCISTKKFNKSWAKDYPLQIVSESNGQTWFVIVTGVGEEYSFPVAECPAPTESISSLLIDIKNIDDSIARSKKALEARRPQIPSMKEDIAHKTAELERHLAQLSAGKSAEDLLTTMTGFAPSDKDEFITERLDKLDVFYIKEAASVEDNPPIKLKNNKFSSQFEVLTGMYGLPAYNEFDPTPFLSIFFLLFFAMCMGDAGYGLLLILIGFALKGKEGGLASLYRLIITLGIATTVIGFGMGGFFGFNLATVKWIPESIRSHMVTGELKVGNYSLQMILALAIGILHICLALIVKAVYVVKKDGLKNSLGPLGWTTLIVGTVLVLSLAMINLVDEFTAKWIIIAIAIISALGIYLFNKIGRNPLVNIGSGLWETYNMASGLMSDVLSYIRLYALALSGGMLGSTFNLIGNMVLGSDPTWQWVPYAVILIFGHCLNLAMSCLSAFVHPLRLNFVEFFKNSGYEGSGSEYRPLKV